MKVACDACRIECSIAVTGPTLLRRALPRGWRPRRIDGRSYILCDVCGNLRQFVGGLSPYLQGLLGLPPNVAIELPEYSELPDAWLDRHRTRRPDATAAVAKESAVVDINKVIASGDANADPERSARAAELAGWSATAAAAAAGTVAPLSLTAQHIEVIEWLQQHYIENGPVRRARDLAQLLDRRFADRGGRKYLYELFPGGPVAQGSQLAGIPVPADARDGSFGSVL